MPLTPADVVAKQFSRAMRGYDMDEVDAFLDEVEAEIVRLLRELAALREAAAPAAVPPPAPASRTAAVDPGEVEGAALHTLLLAARTADEALAQAQAEAEAVLAAARASADATLAAAQREAAALLEAARADAERVDLEDLKHDLERQVEDLRAFEREYRTRLKAHLEEQLRDLSGRGGARPAPAAPQGAEQGWSFPDVAGPDRADGTPAAR